MEIIINVNKIRRVTSYYNYIVYTQYTLLHTSWKDIIFKNNLFLIKALVCVSHPQPISFNNSYIKKDNKALTDELSSRRRKKKQQVVRIHVIYYI